MDQKALAHTQQHDRRDALESINDRFHVSDSVQHLQAMMTQVTQKDVNADTVNAACNCVSQINQTIKTVIAAAKFLSDK